MNKGLKILGCVALGVAFVTLVGAVTMALWNWLVPTLFAGPVINFWQALGLLLLAKILFAGGKGSWFHKEHEHSNHWKGKIYEKFSNMTPDERAAMKKKMNEKWCRFDKTAAEEKSDCTDLM